jgi:hypothetical protein
VTIYDWGSKCSDRFCPRTYGYHRCDSCEEVEAQLRSCETCGHDLGEHKYGGSCRHIYNEKRCHCWSYVQPEVPE